jgi:hypothetical protein
VKVHPYKKELQEIEKSFFRMFQTNRIVSWTTGVSLFLLTITFVLPIWRLLPLAKQSPFIALHYNIYFGVDRFGEISQIFFLPAVGLVFLLVNVVIEAWTFRSQKMLALSFAVATPLLQLILLFAMGLIVLMNV